MERDPDAAGVLCDAPAVEEGAVVVVDPDPELDGDRDVLGGAHGGLDDRCQQLPLRRDGRSTTVSGDLRGRTPEVHVQVVDVEPLTEQQDRSGDIVRVGAVQLYGSDGFVGPELGQLPRERVVVHEGPSGQHLVDIEGGPESEAQGSERPVGDPCHRGEHDRGVEGDGPEVDRGDLARSGGFDTLVQRAAVATDRAGHPVHLPVRATP